ncbi:unnamed protein product [Diamesa serratosioi]
MWMVRAAELFPKPVLEKEDYNLVVPFNELAGESVKHLGHIEKGTLALSNYRVFMLLSSNSTEISIPLGLVEQVQIKDILQLIINCKNACVFKCTFATSESCIEWHRRIMLATGIPEQLENLFAFPFHAWVSESPPTSDTEWYGRLQRATDYDDDFRNEVERLSFDMQGAWRISYANVDFKLCQSYPKNLIVPASITDDTLLNVASFRSSRRIPAVVWRHKPSGAVIARCSQPEVGWLGWRNNKDESLLKALADACSFDNGKYQQAKTSSKQNSCSNSNSEIISASSSPEGSNPEHVTVEKPKRQFESNLTFKVLIVDARSYASAVTNRARGGGVECAEYYPNAEIQFMSLGNIHAIRKSFHSLRQLCASPPDNVNWFSLLERTMWLQHISALISASVTVCIAIEHNRRPVLIHCSDGWDRTPQISSTAQLCLDPYYRTVDGFRILVEKEWLSFGKFVTNIFKKSLFNPQMFFFKGHKFADRCGHGVGSDETNERCPVFLQWIDCVHQIHRQFPCAFEFGMAYLIKLAQHAHSCLFGTFLCNTYKERLENSVPDRTFSVWPFLSGPMYKNPLYMPNRERVLWPAHNIRDLEIWGDLYLGSLRNNQNPIDYPGNNVPENEINDHDLNINGTLVKTRSYDNLFDPAILNCNGLVRRSSDPNIIENTMTTQLKISNENPNASNDSPANSINLFTNKLTDSMLNSVTPPGILLERLSLSFPDGLSHGLSEQNLRLQQIVYEHKIKEDALQRELHAMRVALLKKPACFQCNNNACNNNLVPDEIPSAVDCNQENSSVCSWEAVADNNSNSSSNFSNVLWVPDHSVSRCQKCEIEFWLGRRKHHCRSCGSIFCSDCSNFFAHILDEKPARLCANCYRSLNGKMLENQLIQNPSNLSQTISTDKTKKNNVTE